MGGTISKTCCPEKENGAKINRDETVQNSKIKQEKLTKIPSKKENLTKYNPHKFEEIMKKAEKPIIGDVENQVRVGIFLDQNKKKFWVDNNGKNCFMLFARDLTIVWGETDKYWLWISENETSNTQIDVAELKQVCWLEIRGKFDISLLTPKTTYQVFFIIKMKEKAQSWNLKPVKLELKLPDGTVDRRQEKLDEKPKEKWIQIKVGEFETREREQGDIEIGFFEWENPDWKTGLIIKGVSICPK